MIKSSFGANVPSQIRNLMVECKKDIFFLYCFVHSNLCSFFSCIVFLSNLIYVLLNMYKLENVNDSTIHKKSIIVILVLESKCLSLLFFQKET